jgi:Putative beta-barrel porin 2
MFAKREKMLSKRRSPVRKPKKHVREARKNAFEAEKLVRKAKKHVREARKDAFEAENTLREAANNAFEPANDAREACRNAFPARTNAPLTAWLLFCCPEPSQQEKVVNKILIAALMALAALPLAGQPAEGETFRVFRSELEVQLFRFGNFYQAREGVPEEDVNATGVEYRAAYRRTEAAPDLYANLYVTHYNADPTQTTYGGRVGASRYGDVHSFNVWVDRAENGYAFDVEETRAIANITMAGGSYAYRIGRNWSAGVDGHVERQRFNVSDTGFENDYRNAGVQVRYRGFGRRLQPRIGYVTGDREVRNQVSSYDDRYWYVQVNSELTPRVQGVLRYRDRTRDYQNVDRVDDRAQWLLRAAIRQNERVAWTASITHESIDSSRAGNDFDTSVFFAGMIIGF